MKFGIYVSTRCFTFRQPVVKSLFLTLQYHEIGFKDKRVINATAVKFFHKVLEQLHTRSLVDLLLHVILNSSRSPIVNMRLMGSGIYAFILNL